MFHLSIQRKDHGATIKIQNSFGLDGGVPLTQDYQLIASHYKTCKISIGLTEGDHIFTDGTGK